MKNEAIQTLEYYFRNESNTVQFLGSDQGINLFVDVFQNGKTIPGDAPDMVVLKDDVAIIIEHFEFDSFHVNRKGSTGRIEQARIEREQRKIPATEEGVVYHSKIKASCSYQDYVDNVSNNFLDHYQRIDTYKKNLIDRNIITSETMLKTMFLIEDVSPVGSIAVDYNNKKPQTVPVILAQCPEFLNLVAISGNLDYVLCCSSACDSEYVWFIDRNEIQSYKKKQCEYANMRFLSNHPNVVISKITIPDKNTRLEE